MSRMPRLTYANVTSSLALFIALGGTSYAVTKLPKNSVGTPQLKTGAVTLDKLASGVAISGPRGPRGTQGPSGATGAQGPSDAWSAGSNQIDLVTANEWVTAARLAAVPAGSYVLTSTAVFVANDSTRFEGRCQLAVNGTAVASSVSLFGHDPDMVYAGPVTPLATVTLADTSVLTLECRMNNTPPPNHPVVQGGRLIATRVASLHG